MNESIGNYIDIKQLVPHPENPRINDHAIDEVASSIKRFGFAAPIIARKEDNTIIAGHTRYSAAILLGLDQVPVRFMNLDPVDAKLLMLADNKLGERAFWDDQRLETLFQELKDQDLSNLGWDDDELQNLLLHKEQGENDAFEEWTDMPDFEMEDLTSFRKLIIHFESQEDVDEFAKVMDQTITDKTKYLWFPKKEKEEHDNLRY